MPILIWEQGRCADLDHEVCFIPVPGHIEVEDVIDVLSLGEGHAVGVVDSIEWRNGRPVSLGKMVSPRWFDCSVAVRPGEPPLPSVEDVLRKTTQGIAAEIFRDKANFAEEAAEMFRRRFGSTTSLADRDDAVAAHYRLQLLRLDVHEDEG